MRASWSTTLESDLRPYLVEYEVDEMIGSQLSYAGAKTILVMARDEEQVERLLKKHLARKKHMLIENSTYSISAVPRRAGVTEV